MEPRLLLCVKKLSSRDARVLPYLSASYVRHLWTRGDRMNHNGSSLARHCPETKHAGSTTHCSVKLVGITL